MGERSSRSESGEYVYILIPEHPYANINGYVREHRYVVEQHLGRYLTKDEVVHHINGNGKDNRIENLQVMSISEHHRLHKSKGKCMVKMQCPNCNSIFVKRYGHTHLVKHQEYTCCSRKCNGQFSHKIKLLDDENRTETINRIVIDIFIEK